MSLGTVVLDEHILPIVDVALADGSIVVTFVATVAFLGTLPPTIGYSVHAPDGTFVWRGTLDSQPPGPDLNPAVPIELRLALAIRGRIADSAR